MLLRLVHIVCSLWLVLLLLFGTTPKEFVHAFASHCDTECHKSVDGPVVEPEHHHCTFLTFELLPFANDIQLPVCPAPVSSSFLPVYFPVAESPVLQTTRQLALRGPPVAAGFMA